MGKAQTESAFTRLVKQYPLLWIPIGLILLFTVMSAIILIRYFTVRQMRTAKKRKTDIKSMVQEERREMVMEAYRSFEKMLAAVGYGRTSGLEYEAYAGYLTERRKFLRKIISNGFLIWYCGVHFPKYRSVSRSTAGTAGICRISAMP